jgi:hypothetical protein
MTPCSMKREKPLRPLLPLDKLKEVVSGLLRVAKADTDKPDIDRKTKSST